MQFLPSTWAAVAVDGDDDGVRDVQDIDDAALGSAVYLCADDGDLVDDGRCRGRPAALQPQPGLRRPGDGDRPARCARAASSPPPTSARSHDPAHRRSRTTRRRQPAGNPSHPPTPTSHHTTAPAPDPDRRPRSAIPSRRRTGPTIARPDPDHGPDRPTPRTTRPRPTRHPTRPDTARPTPTPTRRDPTPTTRPSRRSSPTRCPTELADLTPAQVGDYDDAWLPASAPCPPTGPSTRCTTCLADELGVPVDDPTLATFLAWVVDQKLVPGNGGRRAGTP